MLIKKICCLAFSIIIMVCAATSVSASSYRSYNYTVEKEETASPNIYSVNKIVYGSLLECGSFIEAQDMFVDAKDNLYLLDSYNSRVLLFDDNYNFVKEIKEFNYNGELYTLAQGAEGLFFDDNTQKLFIADTNNNRILVSDISGKISSVFLKPKSVLLDDSIEYKPTKVIVDNNGNMYVISKNINTGAVMTDQNNEFIGFYGTNKIKETALIKIERLWKKILSGGESDYSFQPVAINNLFWGSDRFVYSVSTRNQYLISEIGKLNALGDNVLVQTEFADISNNDKVELFDIAVDDEGFFSALDRYNGKIYTYDADGNLISAFGGLGDQAGLFKIPTAISYNSRKELIVLDSEKDTITVFSPTDYAQKVFKALKYFQDGRYVESKDYLDEAIKINPNFNLIYTGLGKADYMLGDYSISMEEFRLGNNKEEYSDSKQAKRNKTLNDNFVFVAIVVVFVLVILVFIDKVIIFLKFWFRKIFGRKSK